MDRFLASIAQQVRLVSLPLYRTLPPTAGIMSPPATRNLWLQSHFGVTEIKGKPGSRGRPLMVNAIGDIKARMFSEIDLSSQRNG